MKNKIKNLKKIKKQSFFRENYYESFNYINESRKYIYFAIAVFFIFTLIGFLIPAPQEIAEQILKFIEELLKKTENMNQFELIRFIFLNNLQSSFYGMIFGVFLGIFPMITIIANGYLLGFVAAMSVRYEGISVLWRLFPHGIFELPAVFISLGLGLKLGMFIFQKNKSEDFKKYSWNSVKVFVFIIIPLLIVAAIIEGSLIFLFG